ncbi:MAG TPA: lysophospholipid acyltransferase family protein [Myxococcota bacterium]|nr:lysophospholipid acyltransferase family protein [Myxococcota bacterium]
MAWLLGVVLFRWRAKGAEHVEREGPLLLLCNHTSFFDPVWAGYFVGGDVAFMASTNLFRNRFVGAFVSALGAFPKVRYMKDRDSMAELARRYEAGEVICIFPEGKRTWDGRNEPVLPGIGRLVKRLGAEVVFCRLTTAHLFHPRWARFPRWVPVEIEYSPLRAFQDRTPEEITAAVDEGIRIDVRARPAGFAWGFRMAEGLPTWLWACPSCFTLESLLPRGNRVCCGSCSASWRLTVYGELLPGLDVPLAHQAIADHFGALPDPSLLSGEGRLVDLADDSVVAEGVVGFDEAGLDVGEDRFLWSDVLVLVVEVADQLHVRTDGRLMRLEIPGQSPMKWIHFMRPHWQAARS